MRNPLDLLQCLGAVFDPNASQQLLNECSLRGGIFQAYWVVWLAVGSVVLAAFGFMVRRYKRSSPADDDLDRYRPPTVDNAETNTDASGTLSEQSHQLDQLLEEADAISELLRRDQLDRARLDRWTTEAAQFVTLKFQAYATDFRIAREPRQVHLTGVHTDDIWRPLKRLTAQMEVLQQVKSDLRNKPPRT